MKTVLAIDPGPKESAFVLWSGTVAAVGTRPNADVRLWLKEPRADIDIIAIEMVACYGMPVGAETFETCLSIGRFMECSPIEAKLVYRKDIKLALCGTFQAKDKNIRQALIDKLGPVGTKKAPGPLYGISGHLWAALAVADYAFNSTP